MPSPTRYTASSGAVTWRVRFRRDGSVNTSETFATKARAEEFCRDLTDLGPARALLRLEESARRSVEDDPTMADVWTAFIAWKAPRVRSDRTASDYRRDWRLWIEPTFGGRLAELITADDIQGWVDAMEEGRLTRGDGETASLTAKSLIDKHALLHQVMDYAVRHRKIVGNPCASTVLPKRAKVAPKGLRPGEWQALAIALRQIEPDAADLADFLMASGWRWSEATALSAYDVEDDGRRVWVTMAQVVRRNAAGKSVIVADGKGVGSLRRIELDEHAAAAVRRRVAATSSPGGLVFTTAGGSQWHYSNFVRRYWDKAVGVANLARRPTPHWLRHTAVLWLHNAGATLPELQARIGHQNISTTIGVYGRMITDVQPQALERFAAMRDPAPLGHVVDLAPQVEPA